MNTTNRECFDIRKEKEARFRRMWKFANVMAHIVRMFPFVRAIGVSGELSKGVASKGSDIDFFIVAAPNRVWLTRTLLALFKKIFLLNRRTLLCCNHITSELNLEIRTRNIYTAIEIATVMPLYNLEVIEHFKQANDWVRSFLPNSFDSTQQWKPAKFSTPLSEKVLTLLLGSKRLDGLDQWLLARWRKIWPWRYDFLPVEKMLELFQCESYISTAYRNDALGTIMQAYQERLHRYGLLRIDLPAYAFLMTA